MPNVTSQYGHEWCVLHFFYSRIVATNIQFISLYSRKQNFIFTCETTKLDKNSIVEINPQPNRSKFEVRTIWKVLTQSIPSCSSEKANFPRIEGNIVKSKQDDGKWTNIVENLQHRSKRLKNLFVYPQLVLCAHTQRVVNKQIGFEFY